MGRPMIPMLSFRLLLASRGYVSDVLGTCGFSVFVTVSGRHIFMGRWSNLLQPLPDSRGSFDILDRLHRVHKVKCSNSP